MTNLSYEKNMTSLSFLGVSAISIVFAISTIFAIPIIFITSIIFAAPIAFAASIIFVVPITSIAFEESIAFEVLTSNFFFDRTANSLILSYLIPKSSFSKISFFQLSFYKVFFLLSLSPITINSLLSHKNKYKHYTKNMTSEHSNSLSESIVSICKKTFVKIADFAYFN